MFCYNLCLICRSNLKTLFQDWVIYSYITMSYATFALHVWAIWLCNCLSLAYVHCMCEHIWLCHCLSLSCMHCMCGHIWLCHYPSPSKCALYVWAYLALSLSLAKHMCIVCVGISGSVIIPHQAYVHCMCGHIWLCHYRSQAYAHWMCELIWLCHCCSPAYVHYMCELTGYATISQLHMGL